MAGLGLSTKWTDYYNSGRKVKKTSSSANQEEVNELREKVAQLPQMVEQEVGVALNNMMPSLLLGLRDWLASGQEGLPPIPSFTGSNSHNAMALVSPAAAAVVSPAMAAAVSPAMAAAVSPAAAAAVSPAADAFVTPAAAPVLELKTPTPGTSGASAPSVTCTPAVGGPSTLAELDAITVTKPRPMTSSPCL